MIEAGRDKIQYTRDSEFTLITKADNTLVVEVSPTVRESFLELIRRGSNTWDQSNPAIQEFRDILLTGHIQQNYKK